jgi:predicted O-linked N-acetylglucosamine transferase (SPINDLY family)
MWIPHPLKLTIPCDRDFMTNHSISGLPDVAPVGRIGTSLMTNLGLPEWVAGDESSYVEKAVKFSGDLELLSELRSGMRDRMRRSPVMDEKGFAGDVEDAYRRMWRLWVAHENH